MGRGPVPSDQGAFKGGHSLLRLHPRCPSSNGVRKVGSRSGTSDEVEIVLRDRLTAREYGVPYRPNSDSQHERFHHTLEQMSRANLVQAGIPLPWWLKCVSYAAWSYNRFHLWKGKTPYEWRYKKPFGKSRLALPFGCLVIYLNDGHQKFDSRGKTGIFVGVQDDAILVVDLDELRQGKPRIFSTQDFKARINDFPARKLGLRPYGERLLFDDHDDTNEPEAAPVCPACRKRMVLSVSCRKCNGVRHVQRHDRGGFCGYGACKCSAAERTRFIDRQLEKQERRRQKEQEQQRKEARRNARGQGPRPALGAGSSQGKPTELGSDQGPRPALDAGYLQDGKTGLDSDQDSASMNSQGEQTALNEDPGLGAVESNSNGRSTAFRTKSGRAIRAPKRFDDNVRLMELELALTELLDFQETMATPDGRAAMDKELAAINDMNALDLNNPIEFNEARKIQRSVVVKLKGILSKKNADMPVDWQLIKGRLVAQGCVLKDGNNRMASGGYFQYDKPASLLGLRFALAYSRCLPEGDVACFDIDSAYLSADLGGPPCFGRLPKEMWPESWTGMTDPVVRVNKALYGLKRAGSDFSMEARRRLKSLEWELLPGDLNIYAKSKNGRRLLLRLYVDDGCIVGSRSEIQDELDELKAVFKISKPCEFLSDATVDHPVRYLGLDLYTDAAGSLYIDGTTYARHILAGAVGRFPGQGGRRGCATPAVDVKDLYKGREIAPDGTRTILGQLLWLARTAKPEVSFAVGRIARVVDRWSNIAEAALGRLLAYIDAHPDSLLIYGKPSSCFSLNDLEVVTFADADLGACPETKRSTTGYATYLKCRESEMLVDWSSRNQGAVSTSTTESEIAAFREAIQVSAVPAMELLRGLINKAPNLTIYTDSLSARRSVINGFSARLVHLTLTHELSLAWLCEFCEGRPRTAPHYEYREPRRYLHQATRTHRLWALSSRSSAVADVEGAR
mmetsp:Transcript_4370/g.10695  ORF Transcript_4370/g.10695 Transcript_4370/m.10695 type:complete len:964 (-) Transcript_4370:161-3052(-)